METLGVFIVPLGKICSFKLSLSFEEVMVAEVEGDAKRILRGRGIL